MRPFVVLVLAAACTVSNDPALPADPDAGPDPDLRPELISTRPYTLKVPSSYTGEPTPLIVTLHGRGGNGTAQASYSGLASRVDTEHFFLAHPNGMVYLGATSWNASCCGKFQAAADDLTYLRAVIADAKARFNIDKKRIYVTGLSNGGFMANLLACQASDLIAAIAPMAGTMFVGEEDDCAPDEPVAVMITHGTADPTVPYGGGSLFGVASLQVLGAEATVEVWRRLLGCDATPTTSAFDADIGLAGDETQVQRFAGCDGGALEFYRIDGGGHVPDLSPAYQDAVVDFLFAHPKP